MQVKIIFKLGALLLLSLLLLGSYPQVFAVAPGIILYEGRMIHSDYTPADETHDFRFSFWSGNDWQPADTLGDGSINTGSANYAGWQEVQTVTPSSTGFFSIKLGAVTPLPSIDSDLHRFLQVEVKPQGAPDTDYQLMDPSGDEGADTTDRKTVGSLPYSLYAEQAPQSPYDTFTIDAANTRETAGTGQIQLQFGATLGKFLAYDLDNNYFTFNDDVNIEGDLTVSGLINGIDITSLPGGHAQNTDTGTDSDTFEVNDDGNGLTLDTAGLTADRTVTFDDADTVVVGENNVQTLTNKTLDGDDNTFIDIPLSALEDRNRVIIITPDYANHVIQGDGSTNLASMYQGHDTVFDHQYYMLSSQKPTLQDLDILITVQIPDDFVAWQPIPLQIFLKTLTTSINDNQLDVVVEDSVGAIVPATGGDNLASAVADTWIQKDITFAGAPTFTPGGVMTLNLKLQAHSNNQVYVGAIQLNYIGK